MAELGLPFRGTLWYWVESSYGNGPTTPSHGLPISCKVLDARPGINDKHKVLRSIDSPCACDLLEQCTDPVFHLEYIPQCDDTLIDIIVDRTAEGKLQTTAFCLGTNVNITDAADKTYFYMTGCKPKTVRVASSFNMEYVITVDFSVKAATASNIVTGAAYVAAALTGAYLQFNIAGAIAKGAGKFAYITDSIDITFNHNLTDKWDHDSKVKAYCIEGARDIDGTSDISLDEGGTTHFNEIMDQTEFDVIIDLGGIGCPRLTLPNCKWKSGEFDVNISGEPMMENAPFTSHPSNAAECSNVVTSKPS